MADLGTLAGHEGSVTCLQYHGPSIASEPTRYGRQTLLATSSTRFQPLFHELYHPISSHDVESITCEALPRGCYLAESTASSSSGALGNGQGLTDIARHVMSRVP